MPSSEELLVYLAAFLVGALCVARLTRLVVEDEWPPVKWIRRTWDRWTQASDWNLLLHCQYCLAPWIALADLIVAWTTDLHAVWWFVNVWLAGAYLAAIIVSYDGSE